MWVSKVIGKTGVLFPSWEKWKEYTFSGGQAWLRHVGFKVTLKNSNAI